MNTMRIDYTTDYMYPPVRATEDAAGWDLSACITAPAIIPAGCVNKIDTGIAVEIPAGYFGALFPRSGLSTKRGLRLANCVGVIDSDYRGSVMVPIYNDSEDVQVINPGDRIAQLIVIPYLQIDNFEVGPLNSTKRAAGGFGSTGV